MPTAKQPQTGQEIVERLKQMASSNYHDPETDHSEADSLLLQFLRQQGYGAIADAWEEANNKIGFWYA